MKISIPAQFYTISKQNLNLSLKRTPLTPPMPFDTVSFSAMKKTEFKGFDLVIVNKFKAPVEKFDNHCDFEMWCNVKIKDIKEKQYGGRQTETVEQRKYMLKEWFEYILEQNGEYTPAMALLILDGIVKDLKPDNDTIPPVLNRRVLADVISEINDRAKENKNLQVNFNKMYQMKLQEFYTDDIEDENTGGGKTGWVVIPSYANDPENFDSNVNKLKALSHKTWCTKSFNAEPYLKKGDFHVYLEDGRPKLGVRFDGDKIAEIQGEKNDSKIPIAYLNEAKSHVEENGFKISSFARGEFKTAERVQKKIDKTKKRLKRMRAFGNTEKILKAFDIKVKTNPDSTLTISGYHQPDNEFCFSDLGINENELFKNVKVIDGNADFEHSDITDLGILEKISGSAKFCHSKITSLKNLEIIGLYADFAYSQVGDLGKLKSVGRYASYELSKLTKSDFDDVEICANINEVKRDLKDAIQNNDIKTIFNYFGIEVKENDDGALTISKYHRPCIDKYYKAGLENKPYVIRFKDLGVNEDELFKNVKVIEGDANFTGSDLTSLWRLEEIGGNANFYNETGSTWIKFESLKNLKKIGGNANFEHSSITDLGDLKEIAGNANFSNSYVESLKKLKKIGKDAEFHFSKLNDLGDLEEIGGNASFIWSEITSLKNLRKIGGNVSFANSKVSDVTSLKNVGSYIYLRDSKLTETDFKNLEPDEKPKNSFSLFRRQKREPKFIT